MCNTFFPFPGFSHFLCYSTTVEKYANEKEWRDCRWAS
nr:MAG TPA: hypothetical protein [Caudoviricetes sp.]